MLGDVLYILLDRGRERGASVRKGGDGSVISKTHMIWQDFYKFFQLLRFIFRLNHAEHIKLSLRAHNIIGSKISCPGDTNMVIVLPKTCLGFFKVPNHPWNTKSSFPVNFLARNKKGLSWLYNVFAEMS